VPASCLLPGRAAVRRLRARQGLYAARPRAARAMSETETVNILPGPHGERLWVSLEEIESGEPLLEGCAGNDRRAGVIKRARAELAEGGLRGDTRYARAFELLDMLTPTSNHATWCKLRDELARLSSDVVRLVGPECELVRMDTLRGIKSGDELASRLHAECSRFVEGSWSSQFDFGRYLEDMMRHVSSGAKGGDAVRRYIVDMARFGSGVDDGMILQVILAVYVEARLYMEACAVCEGILGFEGDDRVRMLGSTLVEGVIDGILVRLSGSYDPRRDDRLVQTCVELLKRRARHLNMRQDAGQGTLLKQASRLATNIRARRRLRTAEEIDEWISGRYPLSHRFLNLGRGTISGMLKSSARLVENASVIMECQDLAKARHMQCSQEGALDEIEGMIRKMHEIGIKTDQAFKKWKEAMRGKPLWSTLPEIRIYLRLRIAGHDVGVHAPLDGGGNIDLRLRDCDIEVLSPDDGTLLLSRQQVDDAKIAMRALGKAMGKSQLDSVEGRTAVVAMDCSHFAFNNPELRGLLAAKIAERPQLAGVFLILFRGDHYESDFVKNPAAARPVQDATVAMIAGALGKRL